MFTNFKIISDPSKAALVLFAKVEESTAASPSVLASAVQSRQVESPAVHGGMQLLEMTSQIYPVLQIQVKAFPADLALVSVVHFAQAN